MSVITTGSKWSSNLVRDTQSIFLVGPSKRPNNGFVSYRKELIGLLQNEIENCTIFNPEYDPSVGDPNANIVKIFAQSHVWELNAMDDSKIIILAMDTDKDNLGLTTRTEIGFLTETRRNLIAYIPDKTYRSGYQMELFEMKNIPICSTLEAVMKEVKKMIKITPTVSSGRFNSTEIIANNCDPIVLKNAIMNEEEKNKKGAIWCFISGTDMLNFNLLKNRLGYHFHHFNSDTNTFAFYKWCDPTRDDVVPEYATSISGASAMILNNNETKVLFVYEESYGKKWWKFPSGAVNSGELSIECLLRELVEELGIELNCIPIKLVGGYNQKKARYGKINDYFHVFVVNIPDTIDIKHDGIEVLNTQWVDVKKVLNDEITEINGIPLNRFNINSLREYTQNKKYLVCKLESGKMIF